jgi:hypothetical protein
LSPSRLRWSFTAPFALRQEARSYFVRHSEITDALIIRRGFLKSFFVFPAIIVFLLIKYYLCFPVPVLLVHRFHRFLGKNMLLIREIRVICGHYRESDFVFYK